MKNAPILLILLIITGGATQAQNYYEQGLKEYYSDNNGDLVTAVVLFTKAIDSNQEVARSYMMRGAARRLLGQSSMAEKDLNISYSLDSTNFEIYGYLARLRRDQQDYVQSLWCYDKAIAINDLHNKKRMDLYGERAGIKLALNDYQGCITDAGISISIDSNQANTYMNRGYAKYKLNNYTGALKDLDRAVKLGPSYYKAYSNRGLVWYTLKKYQKAIDDFTHSLNLDASSMDVLYLRGLAYKALGMQEKACADWKRSRQLGYAPAGEELEKNSCNF
jgi:tetratricopeptide (TPR) repeat protein